MSIALQISVFKLLYHLDARRGRELVEDLLKVRSRGIIDKGAIAEERDARLELRDLDEELRRQAYSVKHIRKGPPPLGANRAHHTPYGCAARLLFL